MGTNIRIGKLFGIPIELNASWFLILGLLTLSLATRVFPDWQAGLTPVAYWTFGLATALAFFACLLLHELAHALMGRRLGHPVTRITLFLFGGVSEAPDEMRSPRAEFWIAIVGPLTSLALGGGFFALAAWADASGAPAGLGQALGWLALINVGLAMFNLLPGFPLDGGRLFRAAAWAWTHDLRKATRWASYGGRAFAAVLIGVGLARVLAGDWFSGFWLAFLGWLIYQAAQGSYLQLVITQTLDRVPVGRLMIVAPVTLDPALTLREVVEEYFLPQPFSCYPVVRDGRLLGMLGRGEVKGVPRERWDEVVAAEAMVPATALPLLTPEMGVGEALPLLAKDGRGRLPVLVDGRLVGLLSQTDVLRYLMWSADGTELR